MSAPLYDLTVAELGMDPLAEAAVVAEAEAVTGLSIIEGVDLDAQIGCAGPRCTRPAAYLVGRWCGFCGWVQPHHGEPKTQTCCAGHWQAAIASDALAPCDCGRIVTKADTFHIVEVLR